MVSALEGSKTVRRWRTKQSLAFVLEGAQHSRCGEKSSGILVKRRFIKSNLFLLDQLSNFSYACVHRDGITTRQEIHPNR